MMERLTAEELARLFHETYERLAPSFGYETRRASAVPWEDVPENNRRLMVAVAWAVLASLDATPQPEVRVKDEGYWAGYNNGAATPPPPDGLVCALCLFVGDSEDPRPLTIMNGNLTCEPHNGYFQGDAHAQAIVAWRNASREPSRAD